MQFELRPSGREGTENKTIRFPISLMNQIENALINRNVTFSGFVLQACEFALKNQKKTQDEQESYLLTGLMYKIS